MDMNTKISLGICIEWKDGSMSKCVRIEGNQTYFQYPGDQEPHYSWITTDMTLKKVYDNATFKRAYFEKELNIRKILAEIDREDLCNPL